MKAYGGFIGAHLRHDGYVETATLPIAMIAETRGEALLRARNAAFLKFPTSDGFYNHSYDVVEAPDATIARSCITTTEGEIHKTKGGGA